MYLTTKESGLLVRTFGEQLGRKIAAVLEVVGDEPPIPADVAANGDEGMEERSGLAPGTIASRYPEYVNPIDAATEDTDDWIPGNIPPTSDED